MKTKNQFPKILFLFGLFFLTSLGISKVAGNEPTKEYTVMCGICNYVVFLEDPREGFYCPGCGILNIGIVFVVPPGYKYCIDCQMAYPESAGPHHTMVPHNI